MKFNLSKVKFSRKDITNKIKIPDKLTNELAYLIGFHIGDGTLPYSVKKDYYVAYTGHLIDDIEWYKSFLISLLLKLFNKKAKIQIDKREKRNSIKLYFRSKAIFTFLHNLIGLPNGPKKRVYIPKIIKESNQNFKISFLRGLADSDFCLSFKKRHKIHHYYPVISYRTPDKTLFISIKKLLEQMGFKITAIYSYPTERKGTKLITNHLDINGVDGLYLWMKEIGFKSPKHLSKFKVWRKYGFLPPNTNINQRNQILKGNLNINKFYQQNLYKFFNYLKT